MVRKYWCRRKKPKVSALGGGEWSRVKHVSIFGTGAGEELLAMPPGGGPGHAFAPDQEWQQEFGQLSL